MTVLTEPLAFDPYDYAAPGRPLPGVPPAARRGAAVPQRGVGFWVVSRHADVARGGAHRRQPSATGWASPSTRARGTRTRTRVMSFLAMDPPEQTRLRKLVSAGLHAAPGQRARAADPADHRRSYLDRVPRTAARSTGSTDFAGKLPMDVISEMVGVPVADRDEVRRLADLLVHREDGLRDVPPAGIDGVDRRSSTTTPDSARPSGRTPSDDLTSARCSHVEDDGDRLTDEEIIAFLFLMVVAGNETTTKLLGNAALPPHANTPISWRACFADAATARCVDALGRGDAAPRHLDPAAGARTCSTGRRASTA